MGLPRPRTDDFVLPEKVVPFEVVPLYGNTSFTPATGCEQIHPGAPIPFGSQCYCEVCCETGRETHPGLKITAKDDADLKRWYPENGRDEWSGQDLQPPEPTVYAPPPRYAPLTRKQKRALALAALENRREVAMDPRQLAREIEDHRAVPIA